MNKHWHHGVCVHEYCCRKLRKQKKNITISDSDDDVDGQQNTQQCILSGKYYVENEMR